MDEQIRVDYLPIGSIVIMRGGVKKAMIIARGIAVPLPSDETVLKYFDYGACLYPEGIVGTDMLYFNHKDIQKVVFTGFTDEDDVMMVNNINEWRNSSGYEQGEPLVMNQEKERMTNNG